GYWRLRRIEPKTHQKREFPEGIGATSPTFVLIYIQAADAESGGLDQICGPGYRKALEFLVKGFLKSRATGDQSRVSAIETVQLGRCIADYVEDPRLKAMPERAAWLSNDHSHYVVKWEGRDIDD